MILRIERIDRPIDGWEVKDKDSSFGQFDSYHAALTFAMTYYPLSHERNELSRAYVKEIAGQSECVVCDHDDNIIFRHPDKASAYKSLEIYRRRLWDKALHGVYSKSNQQQSKYPCVEKEGNGWTIYRENGTALARYGNEREAYDRFLRHIEGKKGREDLTRHAMEKLEKLRHIKEEDIRSNSASMELSKYSLNDLISGVLWNMARAEGINHFFFPADEQYQELCSYVFNNYVDSKRSELHSPTSRAASVPADKTEEDIRQLINQIKNYPGIKSARLLVNKYPKTVLISMVMPPTSFFEDEDVYEYSFEEWEQGLSDRIHKFKPQGLQDLEITVSKTEVF